MKKAWTGYTVLLAAFAMPAVWAQAPAPARKAADPKVAECQKGNVKAHGEVMKMFAEARKAGKIDKKEMGEFAAREKRFSAHRAALSRDGLTLAECQQLGKEIAAEKGAVQRMAATGAPPAAKKGKPDPKVAECQKANAKAHGEVMKMFAEARKAGKIDKKEGGEFSMREKRLGQHRAALSRDGLTLAECQQLGKEIAAEKAAVAKMAK